MEQLRERRFISLDKNELLYFNDKGVVNIVPLDHDLTKYLLQQLIIKLSQATTPAPIALQIESTTPEIY